MRTVISKDDTRIAYDQSGQGPALILVCGASATRTDAAATAAALAPYFTVFAYDRRARGDSGDTRPYGVEREVEDIEALIAVAGGSAYVFGHSSGAALALEAARLLPTKITQLAVYEPPFIVDDTHAPQPQGFAAHLDALVAAGRRDEAAEVWMTFIGAPPSALAQMRRTPMWANLTAAAPSLVYDATLMAETEQGSPAPLKRWGGVGIPVLVLDGTVMMGRADAHVFMRHAADALAEVLPNVRRRTLDGQDHGPADAVLVPVLREFFLG